jgi:hypothetical protein
MPETIPPAQQYWWLGPVISFLALCAIVWFQWGQHRVRAHRLKKPFNAFLAYGPNVKNEDEVCDLKIPAKSDVMVQIRIRPRIPYRQIEIMFGCHGPPGTRPRPLRVLNRFIKEGADREQSPGTHSNHYIDNDDHYHIRSTADRSPPNTQALEFVVQTGDAGRYQVLLEIITDSGEAKPIRALHLTVVDEPVSAAHRPVQSY